MCLGHVQTELLGRKTFKRDCQFPGRPLRKALVAVNNYKVQSCSDFTDSDASKAFVATCMAKDMVWPTAD